MRTSQRLLAFLAYLLSVVGWVIALLFARRDRFVVFHTKQSIALLLFLLAVTAGWGVFAWLTAWFPFMFNIGIAAFGIVIAAFVFAAVVWIRGMSNALRGHILPLPIVGAWARRLPPRP